MWSPQLASGHRAAVDNGYQSHAWRTEEATVCRRRPRTAYIAGKRTGGLEGKVAAGAHPLHQEASATEATGDGAVPQLDFWQAVEEVVHVSFVPQPLHSKHLRIPVSRLRKPFCVALSPRGRRLKAHLEHVPLPVAADGRAEAKGALHTVQV